MTRQSDIDFLRQSATSTAAKLDQLLLDLPERYQDRASYEKRHDGLERRVESLEGRVQKIDETIGDLHNSSMAWVNDVLRDTTKQITDESKAIRHEISDLRIALYGLIIGSVLLPLLFVIAAHYLWH